MADVVDALESLARSLEWPDPDADITGRALASLRVERSRTRWPAIAVAAVVAVVAVAVPVGAHLLSVGGVRITQPGGVAPDLGTRLDLGTRVAVPDELPLPRALTAPSAAFEGVPAGAVTVVWAPSDELPEVLDTGVGALLTRFRASIERDLLEKQLFQGGTLEVTSVGDAPAYWIGGAAHGFYVLDPDGRVVSDRARLAGRVLLWQRGGYTYRFESSLPRDRAVAIAASIR